MKTKHIKICGMQPNKCLKGSLWHHILMLGKIKVSNKSLNNLSFHCRKLEIGEKLNENKHRKEKIETREELKKQKNNK